MATRTELFAEAIGMVQQIQDLDNLADAAEIARDQAAAELEQAKITGAEKEVAAEQSLHNEEHLAQQAYDQELDAARDRRLAKHNEVTTMISAAAEKAQTALADANDARTAVESKQAELIAKMKEALAAPAE